ncbi:glycoside hydrolase family 32 protein [Vibrio panuliri]|uniref:Sucrose-6-phosphate hydrolase n=1 Tax=Vibrio panuliri TaxID=1381081 RepID=A0ABX3FNV8_9VIBR|nr:glycoside hydrolase family 32 protein [Vibrio panuliri]KAB1454680.1 glycoside hydrolase family 32 protein [Vibrio panuliri]OLQ94143.1 sucrose-6-phosphate hydrolase [Vibrio panuliri]
MSLSSFIQIAGGIENIARVLSPDERVILVVLDAKLIDQHNTEVESVEQVQQETQLTFVRTEMITDSQLIELGRQISERQLEQLRPFCQPVPCDYRPQWHISPPQGLLNDPNGFIYHNGEYHLFYQWYPYACVHKDKHWAHLTSKDLVNWHWQPVALTPSDWFDSHGVFSGHALSQDEQLMLFYTGNTRIGPQRDRHTTQCLATSKDGIHFEKYGPVIGELPPGVTSHIRDPKIIRRNDEWLMLLGAQTTDLKGRLAIYRSNDLHHWRFDKLYGDETGDMGYMWECPDMFELDGQWFAIIGPQGIESFSKYNTIPHHNGYFKATWNENSPSLSDFAHLDYGFDFYAPQTMVTADGRRVLSGWMGLPDEIDQPSRGWVHQLTALRELSVRDGKLCQWPIAEMSALVDKQLELSLSQQRIDIGTKCFDMSITLEWGQSLNLFVDQESALVIKAEQENQRLILDRSRTLNRAMDTQRELPLTSQKVKLRILADNSSVELFVNGGEAVMTSRVFTNKCATAMSVNGGEANAIVKILKAATAPFQVN